MHAHMSILNTLLVFVLRIFQLKSVHPLTKVGRIIFFAAGIGGISIAVNSKVNGIPINLDISTNPGIIISVCLMMIGIICMVMGALL